MRFNQGEIVNCHPQGINNTANEPVSYRDRSDPVSTPDFIAFLNLGDITEDNYPDIVFFQI